MDAIEYAHQVCDFLKTATFRQALKVYKEIHNTPDMPVKTLAEIGKYDRYFLFCFVLNRVDGLHPWLYERCREVEASADGHIDLWARGHYKSSFISFAGAIQEVLKNPNITIGIFSHTKTIARDYVGQIRREAEENQKLYYLYPDIFWENPKKESPSWSLDGGLLFKRTTNPREKTIEGWGLVDGQPIGKHFELMIYDDVVTEDSVNTPEMINKTTKMWELSRSLATIDLEHGTKPRMWLIGTRYNFCDTYDHILKSGMAEPRIYPATDTGTPDGVPVLLSQEQWDDKKRGDPYVLACQMLQNPVAGSMQDFKLEWLRRYEVRPETLNVAILVDPAGNEKKDGNCNTAMAVIGIDRSENKYLLDGACHKMGLSERYTMLKNLRNKWLRQPGVQVVKVGYEKYGMQADIEHFKVMMDIERAHFPIEELNWPREGGGSKDTRIRRLVPDHQNWRFFYPYDGEETKIQEQTRLSGKPYLVAKPIKRKNDKGLLYDLVKWFIANEYMLFPATTLKDFLDAMSRFYDLELRGPIVYDDYELEPEYVGDY